jgi:hypothetical protein
VRLERELDVAISCACLPLPSAQGLA